MLQTDKLTDDALASARLRRTPGTLALAHIFMSGRDCVLSQAEVEQALAQAGVEINRVTIYRLLDRFVAAGILHRTVDAQRVSRFSLAAKDSGATPRFECDGCHQQFRLAGGVDPFRDAARQVLKALRDAGHEGYSIDVSVHGRCIGCVSQAQPTAGHATPVLRT